MIELLVVISIVAVLVGVSLPVLTKVQNSSRRVQAINDMRNTKTAIVGYYEEYQRYPLNLNQRDAVGNASEDTVYGDPAGIYSSADLFDILRAVPDGNFNQNNALNPNQSVYWNGGLAANPTQPRGGITTQDVRVNGNVIPKGSLVDAWGHAYITWIDANKDGDLSKGASWFYNDIQTGTVLPGLPPMGVESASLGPDGLWGTKGNNVLAGSDDIVTW